MWKKIPANFNEPYEMLEVSPLDIIFVSLETRPQPGIKPVSIFFCSKFFPPTPKTQSKNKF